MGNRSLVRQVQDKGRLYQAIRHGHLEDLIELMSVNGFEMDVSNPVANFYASAVVVILFGEIMIV